MELRLVCLLKVQIIYRGEDELSLVSTVILDYQGKTHNIIIDIKLKQSGSELYAASNSSKLSKRIDIVQ